MKDARKSSKFEPSAGSPPTGEPAFLVIGKLLRPHGLRGEILMKVITDFPERLKPGIRVFVGEQHRPITVLERRSHNQGLLMLLDGYTSPEAVGELRNQFVYVSTADLPSLPPGEYYHHQLIGLLVFSDDGRELGYLVEILTSQANDVYVIQRSTGPELLLPGIADVVKQIDLEGGRMLVHLIPGLLEE